MEYNFEQIAEAIRFINASKPRQLSWADVASHVGLSQLYFQSMFTAWAGISPTRFLEYLNAGYTHSVAVTNYPSQPVATCKTHMSSTCGPHTPAVHIEIMTPGEYQGRGARLQLHYVFADSPFGELIIASTSKGVSYAAFADGGRKTALHNLQVAFPHAALQEQADVHNACAARFFKLENNNVDEVQLHLKATGFQLAVWKSLVKVPAGHLTTYRQLAQSIGNVKASRAVGGAVASNPVALLIPCHRVVCSSGSIGNYHWRPERKAAIIGWEAAHCNMCATDC